MFLSRFLHKENLSYAYICHQLTVTRKQSALASAGQISNSKFFLDSVLLKLHLLAIRMTPQNVILRKPKKLIYMYMLFSKTKVKIYRDMLYCTAILDRRVKIQCTRFQTFRKRGRIFFSFLQHSLIF